MYLYGYIKCILLQGDPGKQGDSGRDVSLKVFFYVPLMDPDFPKS